MEALDRKYKSRWGPKEASCLDFALWQSYLVFLFSDYLTVKIRCIKDDSRPSDVRVEPRAGDDAITSELYVRRRPRCSAVGVVT